jgi:hypothetical protein
VGRSSSIPHFPQGERAPASRGTAAVEGALLPLSRGPAHHRKPHLTASGRPPFLAER